MSAATIRPEHHHLSTTAPKGRTTPVAVNVMVTLPSFDRGESDEHGLVRFGPGWPFLSIKSHSGATPPATCYDKRNRRLIGIAVPIERWNSVWNIPKQRECEPASC